MTRKVFRDILNWELPEQRGCTLSYVNWHGCGISPTGKIPEERQIQLSRKILYEMCERNKKIHFVIQKVCKIFPIPEELENKTIVWNIAACRIGRFCFITENEMAEEEYPYGRNEKFLHMEFTRRNLFCSMVKTIKYFLTEDDGEE